MATITPANATAPQAVTHYFVDGSGTVVQAQATSPYPTAMGATYTILTTAGTTTVKSAPGIYFGLSVVTAGTASTFSVFDGTTAIQGTGTNQAAGLVASPFPSGLGVRFNTSLVVVTAGTAVSTTAVLYS